MKDILEEIIAKKKIEIDELKNIYPFRKLYADTEKLIETEQSLRMQQIPVHPERQTPTQRYSMRNSLASSDSGIIAEFKRRSPSKGWIHEDAQPDIVIPSYARGGASALSILTEKNYFGGHIDYIRQVRPMVHIPILRKDFIIDEYQVFEARLIGADAILLIAAGLDKQTCMNLITLAHELELEVLLEIHSEAELDYLCGEPDMVGVNNRHLGTFHTDVACSFGLADKLPENVLKVSESGISSPDTVRRLRQAGYRGFLIGESFMRQPEPGESLADFIREVRI